jgi:hypothetical protein
MQRIVMLIVAAGIVAAFGGVALAGGGECNYSSHNQAAIDKAEATKNVATKAPEKADADKVVIAQTDKPAQPASETKK